MPRTHHSHGIKPILAIVGRPNVGKSTLFNRLVGRRIAIVQDMPGVTRDRHYGDGDMLGRQFICIDTGGFEPETTDDMLQAMRRQAQVAIEEADVIIAVFDGRAGLLPADREITRMLQRTGKPVHYAVNKIDGARHEALAAEFWELGVDMIWSISAQHGAGVLDLMEVVIEDLPELVDDVPEDLPEHSRIAVVGKPNAGKSTLINRMLGEDRLLASDVPGTTRDSIDTWLELPPDRQAIAAAEAALAEAEVALAAGDDADEDAAWDAPGETDFELIPFSDDEWESGEAAQGWEDGGEADFDWPEEVAEADAAESDAPTDEQIHAERLAALERARQPRRYLLIDTAGVRRRKWIRTALERYSIVQSFKSIDRADVALLMLDATSGVTDQDAKLAGLVQAKGRGAIILVNKWDAVPDKDTYTAGRYVKELREALKFMSYAPILFISALSGQRVHRILATVDRVSHNRERRVPTGELNRFLTRLTQKFQPPSHKGRRLNIYYATQVSASPPTFLLVVNYPEAMHFSYERFLHNRIREQWDFEGTPIRIVLRRARRGGPGQG